MTRIDIQVFSTIHQNIVDILSKSPISVGMKKPNERSVHIEDTLQNFAEGVHVRYEGIKEFWTKREYEYQELIINGIVVHRETPGKTSRTIPFARVDIYYDGPEGIGRKGINGVEFQVYKEAKKFLSYGELTLLNDKWRTAKYEGKYTFLDPMSRTPIYDKDIPEWIVGKSIKKLEEYKIKKTSEEKKKLDKKIIKEIGESFYIPKEKIKESPLQDLFLTKDIDPKEVAGDGGLSTLYKHIKGDRELTKGKAIEYAKALGVAPASLMFEPITIPIWGSVKFSEASDLFNEDGFTESGECSVDLVVETEACPVEIYRLDIKAIKVKDKKSIYDEFVAYYYETDKISDEANNKLCMVREYVTENIFDGTSTSEEDIKEYSKELNDAAYDLSKKGKYKYYLGIYQIYGTEKRVLNPDPTSKNPIIATNVEPDLVAPIVSFTKPEALVADKVLTKNIKVVQNLGSLIREDEKNKIKLAKEKAILQEAVKKANEVVGKQKKISEKNLNESRRLVKELEAKQNVMWEHLNNQFYRLSTEEDKRGLIKQSILSNARKRIMTPDDALGLFRKEDEKKRA